MQRIALPADEIPTADAVAHAVVAAAQVLGEDPTAISAPERWLRLRWPVIDALAVFYPRVPVTRLGALVGVQSNVHVRLKSARNAVWFGTLGGEATRAACNALEAL